jgi:AcrR family transcriptional regulator
MNDRASARRGYHHGNLREALVEAALALIADKGAGGLTIAEAARSAGVSPAAPYRHFRDIDALLDEVAIRGFDRLAAGLTAAWNDGRPTAAKAFEAVGLAYLAFARRESAFYGAMFEARAVSPDPAVAAASDRAFAVMRTAADRLAAGFPRAGRPPPLMIALHLWSMSHGMAALFCRPDRGRRALPMSPENLLEAGLLIYLQSLGLEGGR